MEIKTGFWYIFPDVGAYKKMARALKSRVEILKVLPFEPTTKGLWVLWLKKDTWHPQMWPFSWVLCLVTPVMAVVKL